MDRTERFYRIDQLLQERRAVSGYLGADIACGPNRELFQGVGDKVREFQEEFGKAIPWVHEHCQKTMSALAALAFLQMPVSICRV